MRADTVVRARIDSETKERATVALEAMGLSVSNAIRLLMLRIAVQVPNATTDKAMAELDAGKEKRFDNADELFQDLEI